VSLHSRHVCVRVFMCVCVCERESVCQHVLVPQRRSSPRWCPGRAGTVGRGCSHRPSSYSHRTHPPRYVHVCVHVYACLYQTRGSGVTGRGGGGEG
jgi:hypothetical protein